MSTKDSRRLRSCPFCGDEADLFSVPSPVERGQVSYEVICRRPHCAVISYFRTEEGAIEAWNTRAETRAERDLRDEVKWLHAELHGAEMGRTCRVTSAIILYDHDETTLDCGHVVYMPPEDFDYCPSCGRKVV